MKNKINNIRKEFLKVRDGFLDAKPDSSLRAFEIANLIFIGLSEMFIILFCIIFLGLNYISFSVCLVSFIVYLIFVFHPKAFTLTFPIAVNILLRLFGKYGRVITRQDWKNIKKYCLKLYLNAFSKKSKGKCYYFSRALALYLTDAKLLYCSVNTFDNKRTGHSVILKNNCVYDTNAKKHFDYDTYSKVTDLTVYKVFSYEEYSKKTFFDDIRDDFVKWCSDNNTYCLPQ